MTDPIFGDRVAQRSGDVVLADERRELLRAVLPVQAGHGPTLPAPPLADRVRAVQPMLRVRWRPVRSRSGDPAALESFR